MAKQRIAIIGAGIVGSTVAYQLAKKGLSVTVFDEGTGQATKASAGIICPWLSQRRNKKWYRLTANGAAYYPELMNQLKQEGVTALPYVQTGALVFKKTQEQLEKLLSIAEKRKETDPMIGDLHILTPQEVADKIPHWTGTQGALYASGGGRVDGAQLTDLLLHYAQAYGATVQNENVSLVQEGEDVALYRSIGVTEHFDRIVCCAGAWLPAVLAPLKAVVDVRPQKGELIEMDLPNVHSENWPVCMLHGEIDVLPFPNGRMIIGATHENDKGYDLTYTPSLHEKMKEEAAEHLSLLAKSDITRVRVGTRAYTSDFSPFFGVLPQHPKLLVASGLGSSGLTSGAYIGELLSRIVANEPLEMDIQPYAPEQYIHFS